METLLTGEKTLERVTGTEVASCHTFAVYDMHVGLTECPDRRRPWLTLADGRAEGAISADGRVMGAYVHGLFAADGFRRAFLDRIRRGAASDTAYEARVESALDALAAHLEKHLDLDRLLAIARQG